MVKNLAGADHDELATAYRTEQLEESGIAGAVDAYRSYDRHAKATFHIFSCDQFALELRLLIVITRRKSIILVCWRIIDFSLDSNGRAMNYSAYAVEKQLRLLIYLLPKGHRVFF